MCKRELPVAFFAAAEDPAGFLGLLLLLLVVVAVELTMALAAVPIAMLLVAATLVIALAAVPIAMLLVEMLPFWTTMRRERFAAAAGFFCTPENADDEDAAEGVDLRVSPGMTDDGGLFVFFCFRATGKYFFFCQYP
jgi:hypothetical protein